MVFLANKLWEDKRPILKGTTQKHYRCIEVYLNRPLFHVDFLVHSNNEEKEGWGRMVFYEINYVIQLIKLKQVKEFHVYVETPIGDINIHPIERHKVKKLARIVRGNDMYDYTVEAYIFEDNDVYVSAPINIKDINNQKVVFDINDYK